MHPILFHVGSLTIYTYGFFIAFGAITGALFMWQQGKKRYGMSFDQANTLFVLLMIAGIVGGKLFMIFENPSYYFHHPSALFSKNGFVFYGSLLLAIPVMLLFFKRNKLPVLGMLDVMAMVTCIVHGFGRIGCFNAGCCYGTPTQSFLGVVFTDPACQAQPLGVALHPTQLYEAFFIFVLLAILYLIDKRKKFEGQVFLIYLMLYAIGRSVIELFRADLDRGYVIENVLTNAQAVSILVVIGAGISYVKLRQKAIFPESK
jgi:phosphatidylglycerol:prolipoprotein diacylglycerol transferase